MQLSAPRSYTPQVTDQETVAQITAQVASLEGIPPENQVLLVAGTPPEDEPTPGQFRVEALSTLEVAGRMPGGKVHGSLDCAGKVTGQTPKVDKQEKKKKMGPGQDVYLIQPMLCQSCAHLWQEEPQCQL